MGWNDLEIINSNGILKNIEIPTFYYTHSYYFNVKSNDKSIISSICDYGGVQITSSIEHENIAAIQFHPEKSQSMGLKLLKNFIDIHLC